MIPAVRLRQLVLILLGTAALGYIIVRSTSEAAHGHPFYDALPAHRPLVIAHRGGAALWPENTLLAFDAAHDLGVYVLEMDIHLSADGIPVVIHDRTVDRTTDGQGPVSSFSFAELQELDAAYRFSPLGAPDSFPLRGRGVRIPGLGEVFESFPDALMMVELKENSTAAADIVLDLVREFDRFETTLLASFSERVVQHFRTAGARVTTQASQPEVTYFLAASILFSEGLLSPEYQALLVPTHHGNIPVLTHRFVRAAHNRGLLVAAWTINDLDEMTRLVRMGVDALITDRPDLALEFRQ